MMRVISSAITQLTLLLSADGGQPAALSAAAVFAWAQPSSFSRPTEVTTFPAGPSTDLKDSPCFVRKSLTPSQSENVLHGPTNRWNLQSCGFAATVMGVFLENSSSAGFT